MNNQFSKQTIITILKDNVNTHIGTSFETSLMDAFNLDPYIGSNFQADQALQAYEGRKLNGVYGAIDDITFYEKEYLGVEPNTNFEPDHIASLLAYYIADYYFNEALNNTNLDSEDIITKENANNFTDRLNEVLDDYDTDFLDL